MEFLDFAITAIVAKAASIPAPVWVMYAFLNFANVLMFRHFFAVDRDQRERFARYAEEDRKSARRERLRAIEREIEELR